MMHDHDWQEEATYSSRESFEVFAVERCSICDEVQHVSYGIPDEGWDVVKRVEAALTRHRTSDPDYPFVETGLLVSDLLTLFYIAEQTLI